MTMLELLGYVAASLTTFGFIPQIIQGFKTKRMQDVALGQYVIMLLGMLLWLIYGLIKHDMALIAGNIVSLTCCLIIIGLKFKYAKD